MTMALIIDDHRFGRQAANPHITTVGVACDGQWRRAPPLSVTVQILI
jgi:hypothetical protein